MPTFAYTARDEKGLLQAGALDGMSEDEVVSILQRRGLLVTSLSARQLGAGAAVTSPRAAFRRRMHARVTTEDMVVLCQQLSTLLGAGVPLLRSLEVLSAQVESRVLLLALQAVRRDVAAGRTFREALAKHPGIFSGIWLNLVETGEASGHLGESMRQLARHFEMAQHLKNQAKTALTYPAFLCVAAACVLAVFVYWLIPKFAVMFEGIGGMELPAVTRFVIAVSELARRYVVATALAAVAGVALLRRGLRTEAGREARDWLLLRLPLFRALFAHLQIAEFSRGLSTLLESGVPLLSSLEILEHSATNGVYGRAIGEVKRSVKEGKTMAEPMERTALFPPMAVQMVQVGEEVGELGKMVGQMARHYEERVEVFIARMTRLFEPIAIMVMGGVVLLIVLAIFMPIFQMASGLRA